MSASFYTQRADVALRLIRDKGQTLTLSRKTTTFDPIAGADSAPSITAGSVSAVVLPVSANQLPQGSSDRLMQALTEGRLRKVLIAAKTVPFEPRVNDFITGLEATYTIFGCTSLNPAGTPLIYTAFVERAG